MEDAFWNALKEIAVSKNTSRQKLVEMIDKKRSLHNLSSALRVFVLRYYLLRLSVAIGHTWIDHSVL